MFLCLHKSLFAACYLNYIITAFLKIIETIIKFLILFKNNLSDLKL